jgi:hypothetical protein
MIVSSGTSVVPKGENVGSCCSCFGVKATISMSCPSSTMASTGNGYQPAAEAEKPAEVDHDHDLTASVANDATNLAENILALDRTENLSTEKIADANRLRESHGSRLCQAHARRRRHASRCRALRVRRAGDGDHTADDQEAERRHGTQIPANHGKPNDSQYPPGYLLVTSMAVTHFGFL